MRTPTRISRRAWLASAAVAAIPAHARAAPPAPLQIDLPQLRYPGAWNPRPGALKELGAELRLRTRLEPALAPTVADGSEDTLFRTPFLYIAGEGQLPSLAPELELRLRRFIDLGGMLLFDDAGGGRDATFVDDATALLGRIISDRPATAIPHDHVLFRSFYILDAPVGRTAIYDRLRGVLRDGRVQAVIMPNDLGGALALRPDGRYAHACNPGGAQQREAAIQLGVNIVLYATCLDYKADRAHVETLLKQQR